MVKVYTAVFTLLFSATAFTACKDKTAGSHLSSKQMENVLLDISLAESYSTMVRDSLHVAGAKNYDSLSVYYKEILAHHKITPEQFSESLVWYKGHPTELDSIYADLLPAVTSMQSKIGTKL